MISKQLLATENEATRTLKDGFAPRWPIETSKDTEKAALATSLSYAPSHSADARTGK